MILSELNRLLLNVARSNYLVNDAFVGDVYTINSKENKFGCFVATPMTAVKHSGIIRYNYILYYIDRLTKDEVNIDDVQSDAVSVLKGAIEFLGENGAEIETEYEFTLFRHQFSDWCAGAYVRVVFVVPDNDCNEGDFNISGDQLIPLVVDKNGIYTPGTGFDGYSRVTVNVPQVGATESWVDDEITSRLSGYATESWVSYYVDHNDQNPCVRADSLENYLSILSVASQSWVSSNFLSATALSGYATESWVLEQDYANSASLSNYALWSYSSNYNQTYFKVSEQWLMFSTRLKNTFINTTAIGISQISNSSTYSTAQMMANRIVVTNRYRNSVTMQAGLTVSGSTPSLILESGGYSGSKLEINCGSIINTINGVSTSITISDIATKTWVESQSYLSSIPDYFATQSWVEAQGYLTSFSMEDYVLKSNSGMYINPTRRMIQIKSSNSYYNLSTLLYDAAIFVASSPLNNPNSRVETVMTPAYVGVVHTSEINNVIEVIRLAQFNVTPGYDPKMVIKDYSDRLEIGISSIYTNINGVSSTININDIATKGWISNQGFATLSNISGLASETWVRNQHYVSSTDLSVYATKSWVVTQGYITTSDLCGYATESWVIAQDYLVSDDLCGYATESWTKNWVTAQSYLKQCDLDGYATENWVERQGYLTSTGLSGLATQSWVENNFLSSTALSNYATESWVSNNFISSANLSSYATQSWVSTYYFEESKIWCGTQSQWSALTSAQKALYTIALITE